MLLSTTGAPMAGGLESLISDRDPNQIRLYVQKLRSHEAPRGDVATACAKCLGRERHFELKDDGYEVIENATFEVQDPEGCRSAFSPHFRYDGKLSIAAVGAWVLRGGQVTTYGREHIRVIRGDRENSTEVVFAIPGVQPGDVVGWSLLRRHPEPLTSKIIPLHENVPVRYTELSYRTNGLVSYRLTVANLPAEQRTGETLERKYNASTHVLLTARDIEAVIDSPYAPPSYAHEPTAFLTLDGWLHSGIGRWFFDSNWNMVAVRIESFLQPLLKVDDRLREVAGTVTAGIEDPAARLDALNAFVQEAIVRAPYHADSGWRRASAVLAARNATRTEAGLLLCALGRAAGLAVRPVLARSNDWGVLDSRAYEWAQFNDVLVELVDAPGRLYAPACEWCPGGVLPPDLRRSHALRFGDNLADKDRALWRAAVSRADQGIHDALDRYTEMSARQGWSELFETNGHPDTSVLDVVERVHSLAGADTAHVELTYAGNYRFSDARTMFERFCRTRLPEAALAAGATGQVTEGGFIVRGTARLPDDAPVGDTWALAPSRTFGERFLPDWPGPDVGPFHLDVTHTERRIWRIELPDGWKPASETRSQHMVNPRFTVVSRVSFDGNEIVIDRDCLFRRGTSSRLELAELDAAIRAVRAFEATPIVLVRTGP